MMCLCWEENPDDRPTFGEISAFLESLLSKRTSAGPGSDETTEYDYVQHLTKYISTDYLRGQEVAEEDYILPIEQRRMCDDASTNRRSDIGEGTNMYVTTPINNKKDGDGYFTPIAFEDTVF